MLEQMYLAEKKNCKEITKCQEHCLKKVVIERFNTIIHSYQRHIKYQKAYRNNRLKKHKKQIQITKTIKVEKCSWKQYIFQAKLQKNLLQSFTKKPHKDTTKQQH